MGRIFKEDGPFLLNLLSVVGGMTYAWAAAVAGYSLILPLMLKPENRTQVPVERPWKMAAAIVTVAVVGVAVQLAANNEFRRRKIRALSGPSQPAAKPPPLPPVGFWPHIRKLLIDFYFWLAGASILVGLLAWYWVVFHAVGGLMNLAWPLIAAIFIVANWAIGWALVIRRRFKSSKQPLWVEPGRRDRQLQDEIDDRRREEGDVLGYRSKLEGEPESEPPEVPKGLLFTMFILVTLGFAFAFATTRAKLSYRILVAVAFVAVAFVLGKAAWPYWVSGFRSLDRERKNAEKLREEKAVEAERLEATETAGKDTMMS